MSTVSLTTIKSSQLTYMIIVSTDSDFINIFAQITMTHEFTMTIKSLLGK